MQYNEKEKELKEIKIYQNKININNNNNNYNFLFYELLNGDIIFSVDTNKFCCFNMRTFKIQTVFEYKYKKFNYFIDRFSQLRDKNCLYFGILKPWFEVNLKNGKITKTDFHYDKSKCILFNNYYLSCENKSINVKNDKGMNLFSKTLYNEGRIIKINEKEGLFAVLSFTKTCYTMDLYIFKIDKNND